MHHMVRARMVKPVRTAAQLLTRNAMREQGIRRLAPPVFVEFTPTQPKGVLADTANHLPPCKAALDGAVDAGLIPDDTMEYVRWQTFHPPVRGPIAGVTMLIQELNHAEG